MATFGRNTKIIFNEDNSYQHTQAPVEQENKRTVFVGNLPRDVKKREIEEIFGEIGPIKRCYLQYPRDDKKQSLDTTVAYITYAIPEDAAQALEKLASHKIGDKKVHLKLSTSTRSEQTRPSQVLRPPPVGSVNSIPLPVKPKLPKPKPVNKKSRLIIRNLSFQMTEEKLREEFSKCGELKEVNILRKPNGKMVGCAFVQYENVHQAINAIKELNFKEMMGRNVAIDWALPKKEFQKTGENNGDVKEEPKEDGDLDPDVKIKTEPLDDDDMSIKKEEDGSDSKKGYSQKRPITIKSEDDDSDEEVPKKRQKSNDVEEGKTMFIRNLEFETTDTDVKTFFEQFGTVEYAVLCKDKLTEHPKGTAFVKFKDSDAASQCLEKSNEEPTYFTIGRRQCYVSLAISKERLGNKEKEETKHEEKDGRNLFLAREGFIRPDSSGAQGVSVTDMNQRATLNKVKKQMLKNLNIFISKTRLCIHNLPLQYNDKNLRDICLKHGGEGAKITEAKVMRDLKDIDLNGVGKSKQFGFVTFTEHINALKAIRNLNNNPSVFSKNQRPIVEFSLENRAAIKAKEKRAEKSKENNWNAQKSNADSSNDKKSRKRKRKAKETDENSQCSESNDNNKSGVVVVTGEEVPEEKRKKSSKKAAKVDPSAKPVNGSELPKFAGLTAKEGVYKLPMMKSKGKITRNSLKQSKNKKQIRRKREGKSKPNPSNKDKEDAVDKMVSRHRQKQQVDTPKGKSNKKWYD